MSDPSPEKKQKTEEKDVEMAEAAAPSEAKEEEE